MALFYQLASLVFVFLIQVVLFFSKGYFLSLEFTLYPYLSSHGFLPYKNIVDQHFPSLFFGPFSLPLLSSTSPKPLTFLFLTILFLTNFFVYSYLKKIEVRRPLLWLVVYILSSFYFSGNVLWVETFVTFFLSVYLYFGLFSKKWIDFLIGIMLFQILLMRPTILPAIVVLVLATRFSMSLVAGGILSGLITWVYLLSNGLWYDFWQSAIIFNREIYSSQAQIMPTAGQSVLVLAIFLSSFVFGYNSKKYLWFISLPLLLVLAYPRFGYEHLQPFILVSIICHTFRQKKNYFLPLILIFIFTALNLYSIYRHTYGNYFYQPTIIKLADVIRNSDYKYLYLFGASDLIYPLSGKIPPQKTYIPSLPWYLHYPKYKESLLASIKSKETLIVVDTKFGVDNVKLVDSCSDIYSHIKTNFTLIKSVDNYEFYVKNENSN